MKKPLTNKRGDVRELTSSDFGKALRPNQLPMSLQRKLAAIKKVGRPKSAAPKKQITLRLSASLIDRLRSMEGYNRRIESLLLEALSKQKL